jgi:streptogrisin C
VQAETVTYSLARLNAAKATLDRYARQHSVGQVRSWYVDVKHNRVVVEVRDGHRSAATRSFLRAVQDHDRGMIRVASTTSRFRPASSYLYEGDTIDLTNGYACSAGFNARTSSGAWILITAGHCLQGSPAAYRGSYLGPTYGGRYPGADIGAIRIDTRQWTPVAAVDMHNGRARAVLRTAQPVVGSRVCVSSATAGWNCGVVQASDQTVNYGNGNIVYGLVRFDACVEPGDSGGAVMQGNSALGIVSGAQFYNGGGYEVCGGRVGVENVSFYQPIGPALRALNARLLTYSAN